MKRLRVGVLFGGRSTEHEVSILSAQSIIAAMDPQRFEAVPLYIDREGRWLTGDTLKRLVSNAIHGPSPRAPKPVACIGAS